MPLSGVIPVMVEEMSLDEAREAIDDSTNNKEGMLDSSELDKEFLSDYQRSMSTSPSGG
jgi:hypothetical protein